MSDLDRPLLIDFVCGIGLILQLIWRRATKFLNRPV